jgi:hypothetical protein
MANEPGYRHFLSEIEAELAQSEIQSGLSVLRKIHQQLSKEAVGEKRLSPTKRGASLTNQVSGNARILASEAAAEEGFPLNLL